MTATIVITEDLPRWAIMWLLAGLLFLAGKLAMRSALPQSVKAGAVRELAWWSLWPGMDAAAFFAPARGMPRLKVRPLLVGGLANTFIGALLLWGLARQFVETPLLAGWVGMAGLVMTLHFGLFRTLAGLWHVAGVPVTPIMKAPPAAVTLGDFWGRRWNRAFRDLAHHLIYLPILRRFRRPALALGLTFLVSGLVHELVITVPAGAGYGLPTGYFLLQATGILVERRWLPATPRALPLRRAVTHLFTLGPAFFLFPPPFVERVMVPFFQFIHALPPALP